MAAEGLVLYTYPNNKNSNKALVAAEYAGVKVDVASDFKMGETNKTPEFLKLNPAGKVPTLKTPNGGVFESNAIARYIARLSDTGLFGDTLLDAAFVESWIDFSTTEIDGPLGSWVYPHFGILPYDKKKEDAAKEALKKALSVLEAYLQTHTYLVGNAVTLADIIMYANLHFGFTAAFDPEFRKPFPNVQRYWQTLQAQPNFEKVFGNKPLPSEPLKYTPPAKDAKPKEAKAPKAAAAAPAAAAPAPGADAAPKEEKKEDPMKLLPPTPMALDSWKRLYSNSPASKFREVAIGGLWNGADIPNSPNQEHFVGYDPEGYSMWACDFKYNEENTVNFVVMNKVGGFLQRIDYVRKYAFGVMAILKDSEKGVFPITGVWIFRGPDIPQIMKDESTDLELYDWRKIDLSDEAQKKRVEDIFCEEATIDGLECVECKVFK
mmetsp:Transcript_10552/g.31761  ORF Transcript_10552/g.31761 Transcript_10552/m.31761 type:complete len:435 (-) Transcript_10552:112-1416(-)|eukprot:CAMPEP_0206143094 /NCGR_PEP_ID=MMETSP1473-20131121/19281_1 /ASSEMBLY_ACC=CAM_ASM_001109 /TAXON_ID=1461547 /ORGANISM="Stichococcus sp, Strain RCC1054" /LENGTH=434 /DNA_ID=CAMNT_0053538345 /DNA_START=135 /DNA_END=1439 /DNA_ORIENTATION=-